MAINQNHLFEDLDGLKCAIVEKNATRERVDFLKPLLEQNGYKVVVVASPPPKVPAAATDVVVTEPPVQIPVTFTIGVTDVAFNSTNAIFGRLLKASDGSIVTMAYWLQKEKVSHPEKPYFE
jgi:hypothetical protein